MATIDKRGTRGWVHASNADTTLYHELTRDDDITTCTVTPAFVRESVLQDRITSGPGQDKRYMPTNAELDFMVEAAKWAVNRGQMIDFGHWPNDMIMEVGQRAGVLYAQGALGHPFSSPYIIVHSWKDEKLPFGQLLASQFPNHPSIGVSSCAYLIRPFKPSAPGELCVDFEVTVFEGMSINGVKMLGVGDRVLLDSVETKKTNRYAAHVIPFLFRFPDMFEEKFFKMMSSNRMGQDIQHAACSNACDPVLVGLTMLNTRGVAQTVVTAPAKLNKARARRGKSPIPPYRKVDSANYVTAIMERIQHVRKPATGTHASPITHMRLGHWRHYQTGEKSFIRDTLVNATDEAREQFRAGRSHYRADITAPEILKNEANKK